MNYETDKSETVEKRKSPDVVKLNEKALKETSAKAIHNSNSKMNSNQFMNSDSNSDYLQTNQVDDSEKDLYLFKSDNCFCFKNTNLTNNLIETNVAKKMKCDSLPKQSSSNLTNSVKAIENENSKEVEKNLSLNLAPNVNQESDKDLEKLKKLRNIFASSYSTSSSSSSSSSSILNLVSSNPNQKLLNSKTSKLKSNNSLPLHSNELQSINELFNPTTSSSSSSFINSHKTCKFDHINISSKHTEQINSPDCSEKSLLVSSNETNQSRTKKPKSIKTMKSVDNKLQINISTISADNSFNSSMEECELKTTNTQSNQEKSELDSSMLADVRLSLLQNDLKISQKNDRERLLRIEDELDNNDETNHYSSSCSSISSLVTTTETLRDSPSLKRTPAISDLHNMNEDSPVTCKSLKSEDSIDNHSVSDDYIEETKVIIPGIKVRAAKITKLVEILIESFDESGQVLPSTDFPRVFCLMHKWFMESVDLADLLYDFYLKYEEHNANDYKLKICHVLRYWIHKFPFQFVLDSKLIESIRSFSTLISEKGNTQQLELIDISNIESFDWMRKLTTRCPNKSKQKITLAFDKLEPEVIANQLTYLEWKTLRRINFSDYKAYAIKGSIQNNQPLERSIQLFNGLSQWIQCMVLSKTTPKQRADIIHKFLLVAQHLRYLQNFNSLMAVIGGICHSALSRLSKTSLYLSNDDQKILSDLTELLSSNCNYSQYRKTISEIQNFWIPIIGIHLKDMISLHTAHMDKLENDLINFRKMAQLSVIFKSVTDLQNSVPPVQENRDLIKLLQLSLDMSYTEDEIYELSLAREPRTSASSPSTTSRITPFADWAKSMSTPLDPYTIQKHVNAMIDAVFKNYDHDRDGFISQVEFNEIAQNFPFIDSFAVLDADKDGMISKEEMKSYFLRANYHALKTEFKHDFTEATYFKPTFCTHCDGFLWGLIKQGWKCKDCGINAHRLCKDRVVIECRSKRNMTMQRQQSNTTNSSSTIGTPFMSNEKIYNRSLSSRPANRDRKLKQKSTQTDNYDDLFMSDESCSSNEDKNANSIKSNDNINDVMSFSPSSTHRHRRQYKKFQKRRKSLPSECSNINDERQSTVVPTLIPRGPLICSNIEHFDNWLPERLNSNRDTHATSNISSESNNKKDNVTSEDLSKVRKNTDNDNKESGSNSINKQILFTCKDQNQSSMTSTTHLTANRVHFEEDYTKKNVKANIEQTTESTTALTSSNKEKELKSNLLVDVERRENSVQKEAKNQMTSTSLLAVNKKATEFVRHDLISKRNRFQSSDSEMFPSNYFDSFISKSVNNEDNDVFVKLKQAEIEKAKLAKENEKIKQQLESANAQITSLKEKMSSDLNSKIENSLNSINEKLNTFNLANNNNNNNSKK